VNYNAILFDLDGTLVDSAKLIFGAFNHVAERFVGRRYAPEEITTFFGPSEESTWVHLAKPGELQEALDAYYAYYKERQDEVEVYPGIEPLLARLKAAGVPMAIVTGRGVRTTQITYEHFDFERFFSCVVTSHDISHPKPHPESVSLACERLQVKPARTLMVGDSAMDVEAGRSAGAATAGVLWGTFGLGGPMEKAGPDYRFESPKALERFLFEAPD